ncbi:AraC family transcriptional regulator [Psychrobium sp. 1_MG-2023]|uniref:helix-turn-helix domain-containing protein n=1 Tax=Psychrobium sp. 1_MG-2023 TaxID=3062624 RepID=UPI000C34A4C1|nr:AraC family transcriptional regulator [Psychrobium sp. 1_MG-2023]MDP2560044.1 AraC family transcriptional regulator [Psychrobium sp. 1_MG-2023]PKF56295.1 AraC family transcriptional regulator [Alteromonadales bacterium alter-6D02]
MKAMYEKVIPSNNSSWRYCKYEVDHLEHNWHYHPEFEICLTLNSQGVRYVGDHIEKYFDYDLVLVGPDLPHTWHSEKNPDASIQVIHVAQIPADWLESMLTENPELRGLSPLLYQAALGIKYSLDCAKEAHQLFLNIEKCDPVSRHINLLQLLQLMVNDKHSQPLSKSTYNFTSKIDASMIKIDRVIDYIHHHYTDKITADEMAQLAHMSTNHFHRFFKKRTERTLTEFINQLRIGKACKLLINSATPIAVISDTCGFNNTSNFNRRFLLLKSCTPRQFRQKFHSSN